MKKQERVMISATWYKEIPFKSEDMKKVLLMRGYAPKNIKQGVVICGLRHPNIIYAVKALTGLRTVTNAKDGVGQYHHGFLTNANRFVDRQEAAIIAFEAKQIDKKIKILYSEDVW